VWGVLEDVVLLALGSSNDFVNFASDRDEGIDKSVNLVFGFRLRGLDQPAPDGQLCLVYWHEGTYVEIGH